MALRSCRVTVRDMDGVEHTVSVTASTLYEAVARGLVAIRTDAWVNGIPGGLNIVKVAVSEVPVEHSVEVRKFNEWLREKGHSPREIMDRRRVREILGVPEERR